MTEYVKGLKEFFVRFSMHDGHPVHGNLLTSIKLSGAIRSVSLLTLPNLDKAFIGNAPYKMVDPTKYVVKVNSSEPFVLAFSESYDKYWTAYANGKEYSSFPLYSLINGFKIDETGENIEIVISYRSQEWVTRGSWISVAGVTSMVSVLIYDLKLWQKIKSLYRL